MQLARRELTRFGERVRLVPGEIADVGEEAMGGGFDVALLANVLHLHSEEECARIVGRCARAVRAGGWLAVVDLFVEGDRSGPAQGVMFALNMAVYTEAGDVYDAERIAGWMRAAGIGEIVVERLAAADEMVVVLGRRIGVDV